MTEIHKTPLDRQLHVSDVRRIQDVTSIMLLLGPEQGRRWETARLIAQDGTCRQWECFTVTQSTRTDHPDYEQYAVVLYCKPHRDFPSINAAGEELARLWKNLPAQHPDPSWQRQFANAFRAMENALNRYFAGEPEPVIAIDKTLEDMNESETIELIRRITGEDPQNG